MNPPPLAEPALAPWLQPSANAAFLWALCARSRSPYFVDWVDQSGLAAAADAAIMHAFVRTCTFADVGRACVATAEFSAASGDFGQRSER